MRAARLRRSAAARAPTKPRRRGLRGANVFYLPLLLLLGYVLGSLPFS
jgi:hypothetical protein